VTFFRPERRDVIVSGAGTYNPFENPSTPLSSVGLDAALGAQGDSGQTVTLETAMTVPTVFRCIALLSTVVAGCNIQQYRKRDQTYIDNPLFDPANESMTYTQYELWELLTAHIASAGDGFVYKKRDDFDRIIDLKPITPSLVSVEIDRESGHKIFLVKRLNEDGSVDQDAKPQTFTSWEVMHVPGFGFDGLRGLSPIAWHQQTIGTAIAADKLAARFYSSGSQLGGIVKVKAPLRSQAQADGIKARWAENNAGVANAGNVAVLDAETDFQSVTIPPEQLQFLESRRWQTTEIARMFGIPPHLVGDVEKSTSWGTGIEQQNVGFVSYTVSSYTNRIQQRVTREVVQTRGHYAEFNLDHLLRGTTQERFLAYVSSAVGPWMTRNEVRVLENRKPLENPEYDELLPPAGIGPVDDNGDPAQGQPSTQEDPSTSKDNGDES